jgi:purine-binding chemotaxis protein CheW
VSATSPTSSTGPIARHTARRGSASRVGAAPGRLVTFRLSGECFAAEIAQVERVLHVSPARHLPDAAPWVLGAIAFESVLVPAIDLGARLGLAPSSAAPRPRMLIVRDGDERLGAVVDEVIDVNPVDDAAMAAAPALVRGLPGEYVRATARVGDDVVLVLDLARILSAGERLALRQAASEGA